ncbi:MAG: DEAD/DEAH box helicase [Fervidicoccaceae archaeon]
MLFSELPLHSVLKKKIAGRGLRELYPPQEEAIKKGLFEGKNILMVTQTASGKTFLAELLAIDTVMKGKGKVVYLSPLKALADEKFRDFTLYYGDLNLRTILTVGNYDSDEPRLERYDIICTTYEKMDSFVRHRPNWLEKVSLLIIDEIHYLDDEKRGPVLESLIANLKLMIPNSQLFALSATVGNSEEIASWIEAELVESNWRPVPLREGVFFRGKVIYRDGDVEKINTKYSSPILDLVNDTITDGGQALVFVNSRRRAVSLSKILADRLELDPVEGAEELSEKMRNSSEVSSLNEELSQLISSGVSYHHAGLTVEQRREIEKAFRNGILKVIVATPTLAAGVNLPARRVIIESSERYVAGEGSEPIKVLEYKQFAGRAGRPGFDEYGEAILIARSTYEVEDLFKTYINGSPEKIRSKMGSPLKFRTYLLSYLVTFNGVNEEGIERYLEKLLLFRQTSEKKLKELVEDSLKMLIEGNFVIATGGTYLPTELGKYVAELYIDPLTALYTMRAFTKGKRPTEFSIMHLIASSPDMPKLRLKSREMVSLDDSLMQYLPEMLLGLQDRDIEYEEALAELKTAFFLLDWINEVPEQEICDKYDLGPGDIYSFIESASWIAYAIRRLAEIVPGAKLYLSLLDELAVRVEKGVKRELVELASIPNIGRVRARRLYNAGFRTIDDIAKAGEERLKRVEGIGDALAKGIMSFALKKLSNKS